MAARPSPVGIWSGDGVYCPAISIQIRNHVSEFIVWDDKAAFTMGVAK